jgi:type IV pilus assembly protein PilB
MEINEHPLVAAIKGDERNQPGLASISHEDGTYLVRHGGEFELVHFIIQGEVEQISLDRNLGVHAIIDLLGAGETIGASAEPGNNQSRFDYLAKGPVQTVALPVEDYQALIVRSPRFARGVTRYLSAKTRLLEDRAINLARIDVTRVKLDPNLLTRVTAQYMLSKKVIPVAQQGSTVTIASAAKDNSGIETDMRRLLAAARVVMFRISPKEFEKVYRESVQPQLKVGVEDEFSWYRGLKSKEFVVQYENATDIHIEGTGKDQELDGSGVINMTNKIIGEAMDLGASDIHFEPYTGGLDVRYRMDGELLKRPDRVKAGYLNAVVSRIKVVAGLDIAERRKPQDGRMTVTCSGRTVDVRVSSVPTRYGEKMVLRILDPSTMLLDLESLVECHEVYQATRWMVDQPYGMILVAGPTGSGKTTTVYSMLLDKKSLPVNIMTIEDPIEYSLKGITQVQRNLHVDLDFPAAIRSFLRQDPDIIIVGETRDAETARASLEAGLTGHLVISTIHANNAFSTVYRLKEMGMEPFIIANSVIGILSQRLVRRICPKCAKTHQYHRNLIDPLGLANIGEPVGDYYHFRKGTGCIFCNYKGYKGRAAVFESLRIVDELKPVLAASVSFKELEKEANRLGAFFPMNRYASLLLTAGITTPEEVSRVLFSQTEKR